MARRLGNICLFASFFRIASMKSKDVRSLWLGGHHHERQLSPPQLQLTSFGASTSRQPPSADATRGAITTASSSAPARNAAAVAVAKYRSGLRLVPCTMINARRILSLRVSSEYVR